TFPVGFAALSTTVHTSVCVGKGGRNCPSFCTPGFCRMRLASSIDAPPTVSAGRHVGPEPAQRASFSRHGVLIMRLESTFITRGVFLLGLAVAMLTAGCAEDGTTVEESTSAVIGS